MIGIVKRYICDACKKQVCMDQGESSVGWASTEIGDLCPVCARAWEDYKESFLLKMRKENGESLI